VAALYGMDSGHFLHGRTDGRRKADQTGVFAHSITSIVFALFCCRAERLLFFQYHRSNCLEINAAGANDLPLYALYYLLYLR